MQMTLSTTAEVTVTGEAPADRLHVDDDGLERLRQGHRQAAAVEPQLRRRRLHAARRAGGQRRDAGTLPRDLGLRLDLGGEQLHHRRRQHDERHQGHPGQGHQQRVHPGSRSQDRRLPGRVRPQHRRRDQRDHEVGRQRVPRRRLRLLQQPGRRPRIRSRRRRRTSTARRATPAPRLRAPARPHRARSATPSSRRSPTRTPVPRAASTSAASW